MDFLMEVERGGGIVRRYLSKKMSSDYDRKKTYWTIHLTSVHTIYRL